MNERVISIMRKKVNAVRHAQEETIIIINNKCSVSHGLHSCICCRHIYRVKGDGRYGEF